MNTGLKKLNFREKNFNISLALLRMYLSFLVINGHFFNPSKSNIKNKYIIKLLKNRIAVPTFFIMSFYFSYKLISSKDIKKIKKRFERLLIPYFIWPIIIWILNNIFNFCFGTKFQISINDLIIQLLTGHNFLAVLWFQLNLILSTFLMIIIEILFCNNRTFILIFLIIIAYFLQYSNLNNLFFLKYSFYIKYPFGRFIEIMPHCIAGYILALFNLIEFLKKNILKNICLLSLIMILFIKYNILNTPKGFMYQGISLHISSLFLFTIFAIMPSEKITNIYHIKIIKSFTNYSSGVYYLHFPIRVYVEIFIILIKYNSLYICIILL